MSLCVSLVQGVSLKYEPLTPDHIIIERAFNTLQAVKVCDFGPMNIFTRISKQIVEVYKYILYFVGFFSFIFSLYSVSSRIYSKIRKYNIKIIYSKVLRIYPFCIQLYMAIITTPLLKVGKQVTAGHGHSIFYRILLLLDL